MQAWRDLHFPASRRLICSSQSATRRHRRSRQRSPSRQTARSTVRCRAEASVAARKSTPSTSLSGPTRSRPPPAFSRTARSARGAATGATLRDLHATVLAQSRARTRALMLPRYARDRQYTSANCSASVRNGTPFGSARRPYQSRNHVAAARRSRDAIPRNVYIPRSTTA